MSAYRHTTAADLAREEFPPPVEELFVSADDETYYRRLVRRSALKALRLAVAGMPVHEAVSACATFDEDAGVDTSLLHYYAMYCSDRIRSHHGGACSFWTDHDCFPPARESRRADGKRVRTRWPWESVQGPVKMLTAEIVGQLIERLEGALVQAGYSVSVASDRRTFAVHPA
jgi:hypothetical protein